MKEVQDIMVRNPPMKVVRVNGTPYRCVLLPSRQKQLIGVGGAEDGGVHHYRLWAPLDQIAATTEDQLTRC